MIPASRPVIGERELELVRKVLESGHLSLGPRLAQFEEAFAGRLGVPHASAVSSGTAGLHLATRAVGIERGDEVVTTPFSFVASANCVVYEGAKPVFCDIDPRTFNIDPGAAAAAVTDRTAGLLPVHIFGYPADLPALERLASDNGLWVVEDACEALGARARRRHRRGRARQPRGLRVLSEQADDDGGGRHRREPDAEAKERIDSERNQGRAPDMGWLDHDRLGFNYRLDDIACALGIAQLERLDELLDGRARVAALYNEALAGLDGVELPCPDADGNRRSWFVYVVQLPRGADRDATIRALRERGVDSKPYLPAIHLMTYYRESFGHREGEFPVCEDVSARSIALPFYPQLSEGEVEQVATELGRALGR